MSSLNDLRLYIGDRLARIEDMVHDQFGLAAVTRFTLVARDPDNPNLYVVVTNEPDQEAMAAAAQLIAQPAADTIQAD